MKKMTVIILGIFFLLHKATGQITKKNWLVGGRGSFAWQKENLLGSKVRGHDINISSGIGNFLIDKFAAGARISYGHSKVNFNGGVSKTSQIGIGPFLRYYFLQSDKRLNLFGETSYAYSHYTSNNNLPPENQSAFTISGGTVLYFNTSVGIELTGNYEMLSGLGNIQKTRTFYVAIGFQIHLEKE